MFVRSTKPVTENSATEDGTKMEVDVPQLPSTRSRRPLGDISNLAPKVPANDAKKVTAAPPLPEPFVTDSIQSLASAHSVSTSIDDSRPYMRRDADNIDSRDLSNPLLCTEVVNEMYESFRRTELEIKVDSNYMSSQVHVNEKMRTILIDWLVSYQFVYMQLRRKCLIRQFLLLD